MTSYPSQLELMRLHVEALYTHDERSAIVSINEWSGGIAPRVFIGRTSAGNLWRVRADVSDELAEALDALCKDEPAPDDYSRAPVHRDEYIALLARHAPIEAVRSGPAFWFARNAVATADAIAIDAANADLLRGGFEAWLPDVPHAQPFVATVEKTRAVSICASVRITGAAHEAGVETLPTFRRRGHGAAVVAAWANAVQTTGALPLYSTSWDNTASQSLAASLGLTMFGVDFHVV